MLDVRSTPSGGGLRAPKPVTFGQYARAWLAELEREGRKSAGDHTSTLETHLIPVLGERPLEDVQPFDVRQIVLELRARRAPNTVRKIYSVLRALYSHAVADELVVRNPCALTKGDLPPRKHKRADYQALEVFEAWEVRKIIDASIIPKRWRVLFAAAFLTGARPGELFALRWEQIELGRQPLGRMLIVESYSRKRESFSGNKTETVREAPIVRQLEPLLRWWFERGYLEFTRVDPWPKALVFPRIVKGLVCPLTDDAARQRFYRDLDRLGLRRRRLYAARRTYVTLACAVGSADVFRRVTHARESDVHNQYREVPWTVTCRESAKLEV